MIKFRLRITADLGFEAWADIPGYEGLYQASTYGRIKNSKETILKQSYINNYYSVILSKNGDRKCQRVHRMVALSFPGICGEWFQKSECNHLNEIKTDNRAINLKWVTHSENINYGSRNKRVSEKMTNGKLSKTVLQYSLDGKLINTYPSIREVERKTGFCRVSISRCCLNKYKYKTAYGFKWKYVN